MESRTGHTGRAAAYVSWGTLRNAITRLSESGLPSQIDRSVFIGHSGGTQNQLIAAMKFLGLIDEETGRPSNTLRQMVEVDELQRRPMLVKVFKEAYSDLFALNLLNATPEQFNEKMAESYNVNGSTLRKAARFFLMAAKELDIEVSPFLEKAGKVKAKTNGRRRKPKATPKVDATEKPPGTSKTVKLRSGGELTVSATLDLFSLSPKDRTFIFELIDRLEEYEQSQVGSGDNQGAPNQEREGGQP